jgi:outer membrane protein assembly factor BamB
MRTRGLLMTVVFAFVASLIIPGSALAAGTWLQFQYGPTHSGFNPLEETLNEGNVGALSLQWLQSLGQQPGDQPVYGTPVVSGGRVFAAGYYGALFALRARDGHVLWTADLGLPMTVDTPVVYGSLVIVAGGEGDKGGIVAAFDARSGQRRWTTLVPDGVGVSFPVLYSGKLYVGAAGTLYSLSATTGAILWSRFLHGDSESGISGPVAVSAGGLYVVAATSDGYLYGVSGSSGQVAWSRKLGGGVWRGGTAIWKGIGYIANGTQSAEGGALRLYAFQVSNGRVLWSQDCGDDVHVTPTVGDGLVFIGTIDETMHAIDARSGAVRWVVDVPGEVWSSAALASGVLYAGTERAVVALDADTGEELFQATIGSGWANMSSPAVTGGHVYVGSGEGDVRVFGVPDTTPPSTTATGAKNGAWYNRPMTVTLTATDNVGGAGVASITYALDGAAPQTVLVATTKVTVPASGSANGPHRLVFHASDRAIPVNVEQDRTLTVNLDTVKPITMALAPAAVRRYARATLRYRVNDALPNGGKAHVTIKVKTLSNKTVKTVNLGLRAVNRSLGCTFRCTLARKTYRFFVYATDAAGNKQARVGSNKLSVK